MSNIKQNYYKKTQLQKLQLVCPSLQCRKLMSNQLEMIDHLRGHTTQYEFICPQETCQKSFQQYSAYNKHLRVHTGEKPYKCDHKQCTKAFTQISNLKRHYKIHTGEKPYECKTCYKKFTTSTNLKQHTKVHVQKNLRKKFNCIYCPKIFLNKCTLSKHLINHASNNNTNQDIYNVDLQQIEAKIRKKSKKQRVRTLKRVRTESFMTQLDSESSCQKKIHESFDFINQEEGIPQLIKFQLDLQSSSLMDMLSQPENENIDKANLDISLDLQKKLIQSSDQNKVINFDNQFEIKGFNDNKQQISNNENNNVVKSEQISDLSDDNLFNSFEESQKDSLNDCFFQPDLEQISQIYTNYSCFQNAQF